MVESVAAHMTKGKRLPVSMVDALEADLTAIKIDEARRSRRVVDLTEAWQQFDEELRGDALQKSA